MRPVLAIALGLALASGCKKQEKRAAQEAPAKMMSADEVKRSEDACKAYVDRVCACAKTVPAAETACRDGQAQPEAMRIALEVASSPDSKPVVVQQSLEGVRKIVKECIEQTAKLPALGCP